MPDLSFPDRYRKLAVVTIAWAGFRSALSWPGRPIHVFQPAPCKIGARHGGYPSLRGCAGMPDLPLRGLR